MRNHRRHAFTLLEVLLALGVFAFAVIGMMIALDAVLSTARDARIHSIVRQRMESQLALYEGGPVKGVNRKVDFDAPKMTITETVSPEQVIDAKRTVLDGFWRVKVVAEWGAPNAPQREEMSFLRYGL